MHLVRFQAKILLIQIPSKTRYCQNFLNLLYKERLFVYDVIFFSSLKISSPKIYLTQKVIQLSTTCDTHAKNFWPCKRLHTLTVGPHQASWPPSWGRGEIAPLSPPPGLRQVPTHIKFLIWRFVFLHILMKNRLTAGAVGGAEGNDNCDLWNVMDMFFISLLHKPKLAQLLITMSHLRVSLRKNY